MYILSLHTRLFLCSILTTAALMLALAMVPASAHAQVGYGGGGGGGRGIFFAQNGDVNNDGRVDIFDFNALISAWGDGGLGLAVDFNRDTKVDILDFNFLIAHWRP